MLNMFLTLIYSNTVVLIVLAAFTSYLITLLINCRFKLSSPYGPIFPLSVFIFFAVQFSPLPPPLQANIIQMLDSLAVNKTQSYGTINSVLFSCMDKNKGSVRGYQYQDVLDAYWRDIDNHFNRNSSGFDLPKKDTELLVKEKGLCEAAYKYNKLNASHDLHQTVESKELQ